MKNTKEALRRLTPDKTEQELEEGATRLLDFVTLLARIDQRLKKEQCD